MLHLSMILGLSLGTAFVATNAGPYRGQSIVRVHTPDAQSLANASALSLEFLSESVQNEKLDLRIHHSQLQSLRAAGLAPELLVSDLQEVVDAESQRIETNNKLQIFKRQDWYAEYKKLDQIRKKVDDLAATHPEIAEIVEVGQSHEGRPIRALRLGSDRDGGKSAIIVTGTMHAREWISPMVVSYIAEKLVENYDTNDPVTRILDELELYIIFVVNPDGYEYSWSGQRLWRKNRNGPGVDLNRNWDSMWGTGTSGTPTSSEAYPGTSAFSEAETQAVSDFAQSIDGLVAYLDYHSNVQLIGHGYAFSNTPPPNSEEMMAYANAVGDAIASVHGLAHPPKKLGTGNPQGGVASDWFHLQDNMSFTIEVRRGDNGFEMSPHLILPTCEENWAGFVEFATKIAMDHPPTDPDDGEDSSTEEDSGSTTDDDDETSSDPTTTDPDDSSTNDTPTEESDDDETDDDPSDDHSGESSDEENSEDEESSDGDASNEDETDKPSESSDEPTADPGGSQSSGGCSFATSPTDRGPALALLFGSLLLGSSRRRRLKCDLK